MMLLSDVEVSVRARTRRRARRAVALAALSALGVVVVGRGASAASWDTVFGNGVVDGGGGTWNQSPAAVTFNWTNDGGLTNGPWVAGDAAVFGGASGGVVMIDGGTGVTAGSLTFDLTGNF